MLDHLVGLLVRVFNAQVTGTKPLQVQSGGAGSAGAGTKPAFGRAVRLSG
jgi:hypothetical protein